MSVHAYAIGEVEYRGCCQRKAGRADYRHLARFSTRRTSGRRRKSGPKSDGENVLGWKGKRKYLGCENAPRRGRELSPSREHKFEIAEHL